MILRCPRKLDPECFSCDLDTSLRSCWALVAFDAASCVADRCSVRAIGGVEGAATLVCYRGGGDCRARGNDRFPDARLTRGQQFLLRRGFRAAENRLDRDRGGLSLRYFGRDRPVRNHEAVGRGHHAGSAFATLARGVLLRRIY